MKNGKKILKNIPAIVFLFSLLIFILGQLVINSILAPLGKELQALNSEKNFLMEENRSMEQEIAKNNSITVIQKLADETLSLNTSTKSIIYLESDGVVATTDRKSVV